MASFRHTNAVIMTAAIRVILRLTNFRFPTARAVRERFVLIDVANTGAGLSDPGWSYFVPFRRAFVHTKAKLINEPPPIGGLNTDTVVVACEAAWRASIQSTEVRCL